MNGTVRAGYKHTEVGVIPYDWEVKRFGEVSWVNQGLQIAIEQRHKLLTPKAKPYITIQFLNDRKNIEYIEDYPPSACCTKDDVLMTRTGNTGIVVTGVDGVFHNNFFKINFEKRSLVKEYLVSFLTLPKTQKTILAKAGTSTIPDLNHGDFYSIVLPIPPLQEQRAIATALSDVDALLSKLDALIAKKRDLKVATMQQLLTAQTRLLGFSGEWEVKRLGDVATLKNGYTFRSETYTSLGSYKVITIANVQDGYMVTEGCNAVDGTPSDIQPHQLLKIGDILISMTGNVGRVCRVCEDRCLLNQRVGKLVPTLVNDAFLFALLRQPSFIVSMSGAAKGGAQPNLSAGDIAGYEIFIPSDAAEQSAIATVLSDMDTELTVLEARRDKTRALKQGMMQELLTGRIRLV